MKVYDDDLTFSTGKTLYAYRGIIGISLTEGEDDRDSVFHGYDGGIYTPLDTNHVRPEHRMTPDECVELADAMIARWVEFRMKFVQT